MSPDPQDLHDLVHLAQQAVARGWIVRLDPPRASAVGDPTQPGQVTARRTGSGRASYMLRHLTRHQIEVRQLHGRWLLLLGTAVVVADALELIRRGAAAAASPPPTTARPGRAAQRVPQPTAGWSRAVPA